MDISVSHFKRCDLVAIEGRIDSNTAPQLEESLKSITGSGQFKIVLDMTKCNFVSSAGWWMLIETQKICRRYNRGEVAIANLDAKIRHSLELVGMGNYFKIYDDVTAAVAAF